MGRIIDFHTHAWPAEAAEDPESFARLYGEPNWLKLVGPRADGRPTIQGWANPSEMLASMDLAGVEVAVLQGWYWENQATCEWHNQKMLEWKAEAPDRFEVFATVQPLAGDNAVEALFRTLDEGAVGVGELLPALQGFDLRDDSWRRILERTERDRIPLLLHVTEPFGHDYPGKVPTPFGEIENLVAQFPEQRLILAHWGGGLPFAELNPQVKRYFRNVFYDSAASPLLYDPKVFERVCDLVGPSKILFGSDYPLRLYPKSRTLDMTTFLEEAQQALPACAHAGFFRDNALRLLDRR